SFSSFRSIFNEPQMFLELRQLGHHMHNHSSPRPLPLPTFRRTPQKLLPLASGRTNGLRDFRDSCRPAESQHHYAPGSRPSVRLFVSPFSAPLLFIHHSPSLHCASA